MSRMRRFGGREKREEKGRSSWTMWQKTDFHSWVQDVKWDDIAALRRLMYWWCWKKGRKMKIQQEKNDASAFRSFLHTMTSVSRKKGYYEENCELIFHIISILLAQSRKTIRNGSPWSAKYVQSPFDPFDFLHASSIPSLTSLFSLTFQDNYRFVLDYKCAMGSGMIKNMLSGQFSNPNSISLFFVHTLTLTSRSSCSLTLHRYLLFKGGFSEGENNTARILARSVWTSKTLRLTSLSDPVLRLFLSISDSLSSQICESISPFPFLQITVEWCWKR